MARAITPRARAAKKNEKARLHNYYDFSLLILVIFIAAFGLIMIYSASSFTAQVSKNCNYDAAYFLKKQAFSVILGIFAMLFISRINYRILIRPLPIIRIKPATLFFLFACGLQVLVLFIGEEINGAKRWLFGFQPSEITKVAVIVFISYIIYLAPMMLNRFLGFVRVMIFAIIPIALVGIENMSTALVLMMISVGICFVASKNKRYYVFSVIGIASAVAVWIFTGESFRVARIDMWRNVETNEYAFQILQGLYAIASGGLFGTGLGESMQKLGFIPESYNDMIFSIICEELGLLGAIVVVVLFILLLWRIFTVAISAPDLYGALLCVGVLIHIAVQVIINIAVVTNSIPATGIPLPFISYGGTSVAILLAEMGMVLSVSNQIRGY